MKCDSCDSCYSNGLFCHETGCPNTNKVYDIENDEWVSLDREEVYDEQI